MPSVMMFMYGGAWSVQIYTDETRSCLKIRKDEKEPWIQVLQQPQVIDVEAARAAVAHYLETCS